MVGQDSGSNVTISSSGEITFNVSASETAASIGMYTFPALIGTVTRPALCLNDVYIAAGNSGKMIISAGSGTTFTGAVTVGGDIKSSLALNVPSHSYGGVFEFKAALMTGVNGANHGVWSQIQEKWLIYSDGNSVTCNSSSSKWLKENIADMTEADAGKLLEIRTVSFDYKLKDGETESDRPNRKGWRGVIAEETYGIIPGAVIQPEEPYEDLAGMIERGEDTSGLGVDYGTFIPYLIKLCQMQQAQIDDLTARVAALEGGATASGDTAAE